jgi:hypothetical protein
MLKFNLNQLIWSCIYQKPTRYSIILNNFDVSKLIIHNRNENTIEAGQKCRITEQPTIKRCNPGHH